ncbi:MAG: squalene-hopene/tetraprenyl-beta-curcumene cyclase [Planctomycetota bacterium]|jgi:squalene-hopene/tetraprenyl-beta-curcumene cyclase
MRQPERVSSHLWSAYLLLVALFSTLAASFGQEPVVAPTAKGYSFDAGVAFLVEASADWREERGCVTCHTNGWGLAAQPVIDPGSSEVAKGRAFAQGYLTSYITGEAKATRQYGSVEGLVATTAFLALSDARSGDVVHPATRQGLDHAWELLDESGTWEAWLRCNWPPFESDLNYGPTLMLIALGELEDSAGLEEADRSGAARLIEYLEQNAPASLHDKAMRLWAAKHWSQTGASGVKRLKAWRAELLAARGEDGGWSMASLAGPNWKRDGGGPQTATSEAYPTAFCTYVLLQTGMKRSHVVMKSGLRWLREHQRDDGSWYTRSPRRDGKHYISRAATAYALMALATKR